jgi:hypothetical protein
MATWSTSTWQNYGSDVNTGYDWATLESVFNDEYSWVGTEWHNSGYRYRASRILFTTPAGDSIGTISFTSSKGTYRPSWSGSDDNKGKSADFAWKITSATDKTCITSVSNPHGTLTVVPADPWGTGAKGYFYSNGSASVNLEPNTQYALWIFPRNGVQNTYHGFNMTDPYSDVLTITFTGEAAGTVKIWTGSTWANGTPYIYNGSTWVKATPYVYNGSTWKMGTS